MFETLLEAVKAWLAAAQQDYDGVVRFSAEETPHSLTVNMETDRYIAQLNVSPPDFRPYR